MQAIRQISTSKSYGGVARCLFTLLGGKRTVRAVAVRDALGLWHRFPGDRALVETPGFESVGRLPRVAVLPGSAQKARVTAPLLHWAHTLSLKLESLDLRQRLARSEFLRQAELRWATRHAMSQRRRLRRELEDTMAAFGRHSHDLKTPFSMLTIALDKLVLHEERLPARLRFRLENIKLMIFSVLRTVGNTLDAARILSQKKRALLIHHDLSQFVRSIADLYSIVFESYGIAFSAVIEPGIFADIDPLQMEKVINNLLSNALKHNLPGGSALISLAADGKTARLTVSDRGLGLSTQATQAPRATSAWAFSSHGFGLRIVRELVRLNRGRFSLTSRTGLGTSAVVELPLSRAEQSTATKQHTHPIYHTMHEVELLAHERTALSRRRR